MTEKLQTGGNGGTSDHGTLSRARPAACSHDSPGATGQSPGPCRGVSPSAGCPKKADVFGCLEKCALRATRCPEVSRPSQPGSARPVSQQQGEQGRPAGDGLCAGVTEPGPRPARPRPRWQTSLQGAHGQPSSQRSLWLSHVRPASRYTRHWFRERGPATSRAKTDACVHRCVPLLSLEAAGSRGPLGACDCHAPGFGVAWAFMRLLN